MSARRWILLGAAVVVVPLTWLVLTALPGPDPCFPAACPRFGWSFRLHSLAPGLTGFQALVLLAGLVMCAVLLALALVPDHRGLLAAVLVLGSIVVAVAVANSSSAVGTWFDAAGRVQDGDHGRSLVEIDTGCGEVLFVEWPIGTPHTPGADSHWFLRDVFNNFPREQLAGTTDLHATLPPDARDTGLRRGTWELWLSPSNPGAYLRSGEVTERWSYVVQQFGCA